MKGPRSRHRPTGGFTLVELALCMAITTVLVGAVTTFVMRYVARIELREGYVALERQARLFHEQLGADLADGAALLPAHGGHVAGAETLVVRRLPPLLEGSRVGPADVVVYERDPADPRRVLRFVHRPGAGPGGGEQVTVTTAAVEVAALAFAADPQTAGPITARLTLERVRLDEVVRVERDAIHDLGGAR